MNITVKGKHVDTGEAFQTYITDALNECLEKYFPSAMDGSVVMSKDAYNYVADISIHAGKGINIQAKGTATEPYPAFDSAVEKLARQLRRYKDRLSDHHRTMSRDVGGLVAAKQYVIDAEADHKHEENMEGMDPNGQPVIIADMDMDIETLSVGEAVMRLDLGDLPALMFKNRKHGGISMIYRRADGNIGWVDPEAAANASNAA